MGETASAISDTQGRDNLARRAEVDNETTAAVREVLRPSEMAAEAEPGMADFAAGQRRLADTGQIARENLLKRDMAAADAPVLTLADAQLPQAGTLAEPLTGPLAMPLTAPITPGVQTQTGTATPGALAQGARIAKGLRALTPVGAAMLAAEGSVALGRYLEDVNIQNVAQRFGFDLTTVEGLHGARTYLDHRLSWDSVTLMTQNNIPNQELAAQALTLYEMANPGTVAGIDNFFDLPEGLANFMEGVGAAYREGRLQASASGGFDDTWVEVFPELTEDERRLGQLPGFTAEQVGGWLERFPAEDTGLPIHTGTPVLEDPAENIVWTPADGQTGPDIVTMENPHSIETISISEERARHILDGEGRAGGHRHGTGSPGKTEFPADWSDEDILEAIREVAGTGTVDRPAHRDGELVIVGDVNGVTIEVVVQQNGEVRTGYPLSGDGVVRNPW